MSSAPSGERLRLFLSRHVDGRVPAFVAGLGITAVLQSSTATGLVVSGFAAEGLIGLVPGLAAMLGANVGTTLIVQLLAFDVSRIAPVLILGGFILFRRAAARRKDFGRVLIGHGLLLFALREFLSLLDPLNANTMVRGFLSALSAHIVFIVLVGAVLTWTARSSVAVVLLAMTLASSGTLTPPAGLALALGANLGTAINPVLEGAARNAASRRLPLGNLLNRAVGVLLVLAAFPFVTPVVAAIDATPARVVANFHLGFNLVLALLFFPALTPLSRLLERPLPARTDDVAPDRPRHLETVGGEVSPSLALAGATREALRLAEVLEEMIATLRSSLSAPDRQCIQDAKRLDYRLDAIDRAIRENLVAMHAVPLDEAEARRLERILIFSTNLEQTGDLISCGLLGVASRRLKRGLSFSPEGLADLMAQVDGLLETLRASVAVFLDGDVQAARDLVLRKQRFRRLEADAAAAHLKRFRSGSVEAIKTSSLHLDALRDLKRVASHLVEASAYPILNERGDLLRTRLRSVE